TGTPIQTTTYVYNDVAEPLTKTTSDASVTPSISRTWTYTYDSYGRVLKVDGPRTDVLDVTTFSYYTCTTGAECGHLQTMTDAVGNLTTYNAYNVYGQLTQFTDPNGTVTSLAYDNRQRLTDRCVNGLLPACSGGEPLHLDYWAT